MAAYPSWDEARARSIIAALTHHEGATLPILHALQDEFGYVDTQAIPLIATALNLSRAEVLGTISFYHEFRTSPPPRLIIKLCRAEACQANGCEDLVDHLVQDMGIVVDHHTHDIAIETVYCLGNCALGPNALIDGTVYGRLDAQGLDALCGLSRPLEGEVL